MKSLMKPRCLVMALLCFAFQQAFSQDIYTAVAEGNVELTRQFLEKDPGLLNQKNPDLLTPLNLAAERGQFEVAALLLKMGADPTIGDNENSQPIHLAAISGSIPILDLLLEKEVDIETKDINLMTPLLFAISRGQAEMTRHLVGLGANVKAKSITGLSALHMSTISGNVEIMNLLVSKGAQVNTSTDQGFTPLHTAASYGKTDAVKFLLEKGADINASTPSGFVPLTYAAFASNAAEMGKFLILKGADVNPDPCKNNKSCTCGPNFRTPLHAACEMGNVELIKALVTNGARVNLLSNNGMTPLQNAVQSGKIDAVRFLVDHGAFLNIKENEQGCTELHLAAARGYGDIVSLLMEKGSCPKMKDVDGKTPLDYAFYYGQNKIGYEMLAAGADDSKLSDYVSSECLLSKTVGAGEASVWFLGHSGWAIKTQNHFLVFDYSEDPRVRRPDQHCMASGCIDTADIKNLPMTVLSTHAHADHFNQSIFTWRQENPATNYVLCFTPAGVTDNYTYIPANGEAEVDGMKIYVNKSTDSGGGYMVEVDGLVIFHMGDHANGDDVLSAAYTKEIDLIAEKNKNIDILFAPIRGCSLGTPDQVKAGTYYTLEKLHPALFVPMHSGNYSLEYKAFVEQAQQDGITLPMKYMTNKGDRFHYQQGEPVVKLNLGVPVRSPN